MNRRALAKQALNAAVALRDRLELDPFGPVDAFAVAQMLDIKTVFLKTSMEGFYYKGPPPRILLSSARPLPRRMFTCAHEIGHHEFNHGSTYDALQEDDRADNNKPEEILANSFAGYLLMPSVGLRGAAGLRGLSLDKLVPIQLFTLACQFGVGYLTLLNHLRYALGEVSEAHYTELKRWTPKRIRKQLLKDDYQSLLLIDDKNERPAFDIETGGAVLVPKGLKPTGKALSAIGSTDGFDAYQAKRRGSVTFEGLEAAFDVRVMPQEYQGAAANRYLEDPDEE